MSQRRRLFHEIANHRNLFHLIFEEKILPFRLSVCPTFLMSSTGHQKPQGQQVAFDARHVESLLLDKSNITARDYATGLNLLRNYSRIPEEETTSHVAEIVI